MNRWPDLLVAWLGGVALGCSVTAWLMQLTWRRADWGMSDDLARQRRRRAQRKWAP